MKLHVVDILIICAYLIVIVLIGLFLKKKAAKNMDSYFLGGKSLPFYMLGLSNASGMFDITGTMLALVVFPEGARTFTGHMGYFKKGAFQLADELQLEVVPVTIDGSFKILPRTGKWIHPYRMILTIHDPIPPKGQGIENIKATMAEAYAAVESALPEEYKGMVKNEDQ